MCRRSEIRRSQIFLTCSSTTTSSSPLRRISPLGTMANTFRRPVSQRDPISGGWNHCIIVFSLIYAFLPLGAATGQKARSSDFSLRTSSSLRRESSTPPNMTFQFNVLWFLPSLTEPPLVPLTISKNSNWYYDYGTNVVNSEWLSSTFPLDQLQYSNVYPATPSTTRYYIREFTVSDFRKVRGLKFGIRCYGGYVVYINGVKVHSQYMPEYIKRERVHLVEHSPIRPLARRIH